VSQSYSDPADSDPLDAFSIERGDVAPTDPPQPEPVQTAVNVEVPQPPTIVEPAVDEVEPLRGRITHLERNLDRTIREVAALRLQVATLVAASRDINKRLSSRPVRSIESEKRVATYRVGSAIAAVVFGILVASSVWKYSMGPAMDPVVMKAAPAPAATPAGITTPPVAAQPQPEPVAPAPPVAPLPAAPAPTPAPAVPVRASASEVPRAAAFQRRIDYVGTLSIDANPGGEVFINRQDAGRTPLRVEKLKAGSHLVWIEREGYRRWTRVVQVPADQVSRVVADLEPIAR
jgi:hypothetical protein